MFESIENSCSEQTDSLFAASLDPAQDNLHAEGTDELTKLSREGYLFLKANEINRAEAEFKKMLALDENNNYALVGLGDAARKRNKCKEAAEYYSECLRHHPGNNYALFGLADCYKNMNLYAKAIEIWEQYLEHDNANITVFTRVADAYRKIHDFQNSKKLYLKVLEIEENNPYALIGLGHLHYDFKKYREALVYWQKIFDQNPEDVDIRILTSIGMKQQQHSIKYWEAILSKDPNNKVILTRMGDAYRYIGDYEKAEQIYQRALDIDYDSYAILGLAILCKIQGKYDEAITSLTHLLQADRKNYRIYLELADCYIHTNEKAKAIEVLQAFQQYGIKNQAVSDTLFSLQN